MAGLFDYEFQLDEIKKHQPPLQKLNEIIDWELFRKPIEEALNKDDRKSNAGRKPYDKILMFKIVILQRYYNLSDEQIVFLSGTLSPILNPKKSRNDNLSFI